MHPASHSKHWHVRNGTLVSVLLMAVCQSTGEVCAQLTNDLPPISSTDLIDKNPDSIAGNVIVGTLALLPVQQFNINLGEPSSIDSRHDLAASVEQQSEIINYESSSSSYASGQSPSPPAPWWTGLVSLPFRGSQRVQPITLDSLFAMTAANSGRVQAIAQTPWINETQVQQALAAFDPTLYSDARFDSTSDPVGNTLTTGGPPRLDDNTVAMNAGLRGQNQSGTTYSMGQRLGHKNSNSTFFLPQDQGSARLAANLTKPLMRGRQTDVNRTLVLTAQFQTNGARAEYLSGLQKQLFQVAETYWLLYVERASLLQRQRHLARASEISELLMSREFHDSASNQILRARAAVANRTAELAQADARIRNLESRLRALTNAPELINDRTTEFLPVQPALLLAFEFNIEYEVAIALERRPELAELQSKIDVVNARLHLAQDQTKSTLNLVAEGYLAGLQGQSDVFGAWNNQFTDGRPGYAGGLIYELPYRKRAATFAVRQKQLEAVQLWNLLRESRENVRAEVETAARDVQALAQSSLGRQQSLVAVEAEVEALLDRWKTLGNDPRLGQLQLGDLLNAQDRLLQEEQSLLQALVQYNRAVLEVQRSTGKLIQFAP